jgi:hypothetical protein
MGGTTGSIDLADRTSAPNKGREVEGHRGLEIKMAHTGRIETSARLLGSSCETPRPNHSPVAQAPTQSREHNARATSDRPNGASAFRKESPGFKIRIRAMQLRYRP